MKARQIDLQTEPGETAREDLAQSKSPRPQLQREGGILQEARDPQTPGLGRKKSRWYMTERGGDGHEGQDHQGGW